MNTRMRTARLALTFSLLSLLACDESADAPAQNEASSKDSKAADDPASKGGAQYCDVRSNEDSPNFGTCWEYPDGFPSPHLCAGYRGTAAELCPTSAPYVGKCHFPAIHKQTRDGSATSTVTREEFFVYAYAPEGASPRFAAAKQSECEGEKGVWQPG